MQIRTTSLPQNSTLHKGGLCFGPKHSKNLRLRRFSNLSITVAINSAHRRLETFGDEGRKPFCELNYASACLKLETNPIIGRSVAFKGVFLPIRTDPRAQTQEFATRPRCRPAQPGQCTSVRRRAYSCCFFYARIPASSRFVDLEDFSLKFPQISSMDNLKNPLEYLPFSSLFNLFSFLTFSLRKYETRKKL